MWSLLNVLSGDNICLIIVLEEELDDFYSAVAQPRLRERALYMSSKVNGSLMIVSKD